jgi:hypothetical protein
LIQLLTEGQVSDYRGAETVLQALAPSAMAMITVWRHDSDWFRQALSDLDITPCVAG